MKSVLLYDFMQSFYGLYAQRKAPYGCVVNMLLVCGSDIENQSAPGIGYVHIRSMQNLWMIAEHGTEGDILFCRSSRFIAIVHRNGESDANRQTKG